jgi:hypothetical protein
MSHCNRLTTNIDLSTLKVLVEAHGSRVGFSIPMTKTYTLGPLDDITLTQLASM